MHRGAIWRGGLRSRGHLNVRAFALRPASTSHVWKCNHALKETLLKPLLPCKGLPFFAIRADRAFPGCPFFAIRAGEASPVPYR